MANTIALAKNYLDIIDEVYKSASVTADLTSDASMMRAGSRLEDWEIMTAIPVILLRLYH